MTPARTAALVSPSTMLSDRGPRLAWSGDERRSPDRPSDVASALISAFDHAVRRAELDLVMVADEFGTVVANSSTHLDLAELAAVTPIVGRGQATALIHRRGKQRELSVRRMRVMGELLYVAALGGTTRRREREVVTTAAAARRILCS